MIEPFQSNIYYSGLSFCTIKTYRKAKGSNQFFLVAVGRFPDELHPLLDDGLGVSPRQLPPQAGHHVAGRSGPPDDLHLLFGGIGNVARKKFDPR